MLTTGIHYLRGARARDDALAIGDAIRDYFAARGEVQGGLQSKLQRLRKSGVFKPFGNDVVHAAITAVLGDDWYEMDDWGAPLITFPVPGPWVMPTKIWHSDHPAEGSPERVQILRMFGFASDVAPQGGGTLVIEGSHELIRRMVANNDGGSSAQVKKKLVARYPWFQAPDFEGTEIDGVHIRVRELTGQPGDVVFMLPWTLHNFSMNTSDRPRFMVTHTAFAR